MAEIIPFPSAAQAPRSRPLRPVRMPAGAARTLTRSEMRTYQDYLEFNAQLNARGVCFAECEPTEAEYELFRDGFQLRLKLNDARSNRIRAWFEGHPRVYLDRRIFDLLAAYADLQGVTPEQAIDRLLGRELAHARP